MPTTPITVIAPPKPAGMPIANTFVELHDVDFELASCKVGRGYYVTIDPDIKDVWSGTIEDPDEARGEVNNPV